MIRTVAKGPVGPRDKGQVLVGWGGRAFSLQFRLSLKIRDMDINPLISMHASITVSRVILGWFTLRGPYFSGNHSLSREAVEMVKIVDSSTRAKVVVI